MAQKSNPALIGAFVVVAMVLLAVGLLTFSQAKFFRQNQTFVAYFTGSVKGLREGALVSFRGVPVGTVADIGLIYDPTHTSFRIPVFLDIDQEHIDAITVGSVGRRSTDAVLKDMVQQGLRAHLALESILTGQLFVQLDFFPNAELSYQDSLHQYPEIPTIPSPLQELTQSLQEVPLREVVMAFQHAVEKADQLLSSPDLEKSIQAFRRLLESSDKLVSGLNQQLPQLGQDLRGATEEARLTLQEVAAAMQTFQDSFAADTPLQHDLSSGLKDLAAAARAITALADYLERHPNALLYGKPQGVAP